MSASYDSLFLFRGISTSSACAYGSAGQGTTLWPAPQLVKSAYAILQAADIYLLDLSLPAEQFWTGKIPHLQSCLAFAIQRLTVGRLWSCSWSYSMTLLRRSQRTGGMLRRTGPGTPNPNAGGSVGFHVFEQEAMQVSRLMLIDSCYDIKYSGLLYTCVYREVMNILDSSGSSTLFSIAFLQHPPPKGKKGTKAKTNLENLVCALTYFETHRTWRQKTISRL